MSNYYAKNYRNLRSILYGLDHANKVDAALGLLDLGCRKTVEHALKTAKSPQTRSAARIALKRWKP